MMKLFDEEQIIKTYAKDLARETTKRIAMTMLRKGLVSVEEIPDFFPELTLVDIEEIENEVSSSSQQTD